MALLDEAAGNARVATETLRDLLDDYPERRHLARELLKQEQEGDRITHDILHRLAENGVRSPFPSADVHALVGAIDDIVDYAEQTADSLGLYGVEAPMEQAQQLAGVLAQAGAAVEAAVGSLRDRSELGGRLVPIHQLE